MTGREPLGRVLVTGGAGFLGSHLAERLLADGTAVDVVDDLSSGSLANLAPARAMSDRSLSIHTLDVRAPGFVDLAARRRPEVIVHLAQRAPADADDREAAELLVVGTLNVLDAARAAGARKTVLVLDAGDVYGDVPARDLPVKEGWRGAPQTLAQAMARAVLDLAAVHRGRYALEFTALALADVYGPRQRPDAGIVAAVVADPHGVVSDPRWQVDAVYVDDAVDAVARATTRGTGLLVNVGTGQAVAAKGVQRRVVRTRQQRLTLSPVRARIHLGWEAYTPFVEGLAATVAAWAERTGVMPEEPAAP